ncbi:glycosyltransferase family 2 protein [Streptomyces sp. NPDC051561]|uniref:glycosyltransferase family 2 protein n=1 Tax=Streptomyces sp. NPDC051561 TaxID=3365658 RepID=UPI0037B88088
MTDTAPPRISCVILCHNYGRYLDRAITSCLQQEPGNYVLHEILVIDDGSTDETPDICDRHRGHIRVIRRDQQGFGPTLTDAFHLATGDWVAPLDADDFFHPAKLRTCAEAMTDDRLYLEHWEYVVDANGHPFLPDPHPGGNTSTLLVQREAALTLLPATNEIFFHALKEAGRGYILPTPLTYYRLHPLSMTDRRNHGISQQYRAKTCTALADRLHAMRQLPPPWAGPRTVLRIENHFRALATSHRVEAYLQLGTRPRSLLPLASMLIHTLRARDPLSGWLRALRSALTNHPLAPLPHPPHTETESDQANTAA